LRYGYSVRATLAAAQPYRWGFDLAGRSLIVTAGPGRPSTSRATAVALVAPDGIPRARLCVVIAGRLAPGVAKATIWRRLITDTVESVTVAPAMTADGRPSHLWDPGRIDISFLGQHP
jgi:hypothetical protein